MNIPEGYVLVPVEPTRAQLVAGLGTNGIHPIYCAMVAAAPPVELTAYDESKERELFAKWKAYPIPPLNSDGQFDKEYLQREWSSWKACAKSRARSAE